MLRQVKLEVPYLLAAGRLQSGCVHLMFDSEKAKKSALNQDLHGKLGSYMLEEDFLVEVLAVPTSLFKFHYGEEAGRTEAVCRLQEIVQKTVPGAVVTRASWIHSRKTQEKRQKGSLVVYL